MRRAIRTFVAAAVIAGAFPAVGARAATNSDQPRRGPAKVAYAKVVLDDSGRQHVQPRRQGCRTRALLAPHQLDDRGVRADEHEPRLLHRLGKCRVLRKESIAGVDGVSTGVQRGLQQRRDAQIGVDGRGWPDAHGPIGRAHMPGAGIRIGVDRNRRQPEFMRRAHDAQRDLSAIGDEESGVRGDGCHGRQHRHIRKTP